MRRRPTGEPCKAKTDALGRAGRRAAGAGAPAAARAAKWAARGRARKCRAGVAATGGLEWACVWRQAPCVGWSARTGGRVRMGDSRVRMARRPRPALGRRASTPPGRGRREALVLGQPVTCRHLQHASCLGDQSRASDTRPQSRVSGIRGCRAFTGVGRRLRVWRGGVTKPQPMDSPWTAHVERRGGGEGTRRVAPLSAGCMTGCGCDGWAVERRALGIRVTCWGGHPSHLLGWAVERRASAADAAHAAAAAGRRAGAGCCQWLRGTGSTQSRGPAADTAPRGRSLCLSCEVGMGVPLIRAQRRAGLRRRS